MKHNKIMGICLFLGIIFLFVSTGYSKMVTVIGQGVDRKSAIADAQRAAVEQGIGALIDSKTKVANFEVLQDKIYSRASGYVTNYNILSEGKTPDGW